MIDAFLSEFEDIYQKSGVSRPFDEYLQLGKMVLFIGFLAEYFVLFGIHYLLGVQGTKLFSGPMILSVLFTLVTFVLFAWYPLYVRDMAVHEIDKNLLYTVTFMLMLSKGGLAIERIIERVSETEQSQYLRNFFNKFLVNISIFGFNPKESLQDVKNRSPSEIFSRFLDSIVNTIQTSGDLSSLFQFEAEQLIQRKEEENNELLNNLGFLSEIYVTMLVIAPLLLLVLLTTFSFAGQSSGTSGINSLNLVVFGGIPLLSILMIILIDMQVSVD